MNNIKANIAFQEGSQENNINLVYSTDQTYLLNQLLKQMTIMGKTLNSIDEMWKKYILRTNPDPDTIPSNQTTPYWEYENKFKVNPSNNSGIIPLQITKGLNSVSKDGYLVFLDFFSDSADADNPGTWTFYINGTPISPLSNKASTPVGNKSATVSKTPVVIKFRTGDQIFYIATNTSTAAIVEFSMRAEGWYIG